MISEIGKEMLSLQESLAKQYKYKLLPSLIAKMNMEKYCSTIPKEFSGTLYKVENKPGFEIKGKNIPLYTHCGTKICSKYDRIVIGHYGAFIEIDLKDIIQENIKVKPGQEYRMNDPNYQYGIKYFWMTATDNSNCKIYNQVGLVKYADYKCGKWYISPFEVMTNNIS